MLKRRDAVAASSGDLPECVPRGRKCRVPIDETLQDRFGLVEAAEFAQFGRDFAGVPSVAGIMLGRGAEMFKRRDAVAASSGDLPEPAPGGCELGRRFDQALRDRFGLVEAAEFAQFGRGFAGVPWVGGIAHGGGAEMFERRDAVTALSGDLPERVPRGREVRSPIDEASARSLRPRRGDRGRAVQPRLRRRSKGSKDRARRRRENARALQHGRRVRGRLQPCAFRRSR